MFLSYEFRYKIKISAIILPVCVIILPWNECNLISVFWEETYHWRFALLQKTATNLGLFSIIKVHVFALFLIKVSRLTVFLLFLIFIYINFFLLSSEHPSVYALFLSIIVLHRQNEKWDNILLYFPSKYFFVKCFMILIGINSVSPPQRMSVMNHDKNYRKGYWIQENIRPVLILFLSHLLLAGKFKTGRIAISQIIFL